MPSCTIQLEQRFQPLVERLHRFLAPCIDPFALLAFQVLSTFCATTSSVRSTLVVLARLGFPSLVPRILRAQIVAAFLLAVRVIFHLLGQSVAIVATVERRIHHSLGQLSKLLGASLH